MTPEELDGLGFHLTSESELNVEYCFGAGAERAVV